MLMIIGFVIVSFKNEINLVEKDYYPKGQEYQQRLNEMKNASLKKELFSFSQTNSGIKINLPLLNADTASLYFFRPSDTKLDRIFDISSNDTVYNFDAGNFQKGKYKLKIYWNSDDIGYYFEKDFYFN